MMGGQTAAPQPAPGSTDPLGDNPFGKVLQDMFGGGRRSQTAAAGAHRPGRRQSAGARSFEDMLGGGGASRAGAAAGQRKRRAPASPRRIPTMTFSARCSRRAASSATTTRRASNRSSISSRRAWTAADQAERPEKKPGPGRTGQSCRQAGGAGREWGACNGEPRVPAAAMTCSARWRSGCLAGSDPRSVPARSIGQRAQHGRRIAAERAR